MLIRRSVILALCLAVAGVLLGQSIEPHRPYGATMLTKGQVRSLEGRRSLLDGDRLLRTPNRLFVARIG